MEKEITTESDMNDMSDEEVEAWLANNKTESNDLGASKKYRLWQNVANALLNRALDREEQKRK